MNLCLILGPDLPIPLFGHEMVSLGNGQAIIGGFSTNSDNSKIFMATCSNRDCRLDTLRQELFEPRGYFVAIPIPTNMTECGVQGGVEGTITFALLGLDLDLQF